MAVADACGYHTRKVKRVNQLNGAVVYSDAKESGVDKTKGEEMLRKNSITEVPSFAHRCVAPEAASLYHTVGRKRSQCLT